MSIHYIKDRRVTGPHLQGISNAKHSKSTVGRSDFKSRSFPTAFLSFGRTVAFFNCST